MRSRAGSTASEAQSAFWIASEPDAAHMICSRRVASRPGLQVRDEPPDGVRLDPGNRVVGGERDRFEVARPRRGLEPAHVAQEFPLPFDRVVTEIRDEHARRVVVQLAAVGGPVEDAGALGDRQPAWACRCGAPQARAGRSPAGWRSTGSLLRCSIAMISNMIKSCQFEYSTIGSGCPGRCSVMRPSAAMRATPSGAPPAACARIASIA